MSAVVPRGSHSNGIAKKGDRRRGYMRGGRRRVKEVLSNGVMGARHPMGQINQATRIADELTSIAVHNQSKYGVIPGGLRKENFMVRANDLLAVCNEDLGIACLESRMYGVANGMDSHGPGLTIAPSACGVYLPNINEIFRKKLVTANLTDEEMRKEATMLTRALIPFFVRPAGVANLGEKSQGAMKIRTVTTSLGGLRTVINGWKDSIRPLDQLVWAVRLEGETRVALPGDFDDRDNFILKPIRNVIEDLITVIKRIHVEQINDQNGKLVIGGIIDVEQLLRTLRPVATALQGAESGEQYDINLHI